MKAKPFLAVCVLLFLSMAGMAHAQYPTLLYAFSGSGWQVDTCNGYTSNISYNYDEPLWNGQNSKELVAFPNAKTQPVGLGLIDLANDFGSGRCGIQYTAAEFPNTGTWRMEFQVQAFASGNPSSIPVLSVLLDGIPQQIIMYPTGVSIGSQTSIALNQQIAGMYEYVSVLLNVTITGTHMLEWYITPQVAGGGGQLEISQVAYYQNQVEVMEQKRWCLRTGGCLVSNTPQTFTDLITAATTWMDQTGGTYFLDLAGNQMRSDTSCASGQCHKLEIASKPTTI